MTEAQASGPGAPKDALYAFGEAVGNAASVAEADRTDPHVTDAFALGWQMAELYRPEQRRKHKDTSGDLPGLSSLDDAERMEILVDQIQLNITHLHGPISEVEGTAIDLSNVRASVKKAQEEREGAVLVLHRQLLAVLTAADYRLGKAYGLGRALADTCRKPTNVQELREQLESYRIMNLTRWLDDLSSALPAHAAHSARWRGLPPAVAQASTTSLRPASPPAPDEPKTRPTIRANRLERGP